MSTPLELSIRQLKAKMDRETKWLEEQSNEYCPPNHCCPSCACPGYAARCDKQERREAWLNILVYKQYRKTLPQ